MLGGRLTGAWWHIDWCLVVLRLVLGGTLTVAWLHIDWYLVAH